MIGSPSHLLLSLVAGRAAQRNRTLRWGDDVPAFSVGRGGDWCISAPGVADAHVLLAFDGARLRVASVSPRSAVKVHGAALPPGWSELTLPAEIQFGEARLRARTVFHASTNLATTQLVDLRALAPLLRATLPDETPALTNPALLETVCDGGALQAEARRLAAEARRPASWRDSEPLQRLRRLAATLRERLPRGARWRGLAALGVCTAVLLGWRVVRSENTPEPAISAEALAREMPAAAPATEIASASAPTPPLPELPPPPPELQRDALRAALNGDERAADLYQRLGSGPDARTFQLAARLSARGRVRKP
ncbi:MAG TPA: hypothetical protein VFS67_18900 [Polyangiaceae bacterium]|nr:hypothetical protein [Polyangiaceae bacterium]